MNRRDAGEPQEEDAAFHILVVDDDQRIRTLLCRFLRKEGFRVTAVDSAIAARRAMERFVFDAIVLDVMMPGEDGLSLLGFVRAESRVPILMLTARSEPEARIEGLERGASDYLAKPFEPRELSLRLSNLISRSARRAVSVRFGPFLFDIEREELTSAGTPLRLTDRERRLMLFFARRPGATIARQDLVADEEMGDRAIDVQINRLRRKIEADPSNPKYLQTIRGVGYRLMVDPPAFPTGKA